MSESSWLWSFENRSISLVAGSWDSSSNGELDVVLSEEMRFRSSNIILVSEDCGSDDRDGVSRGSVITSHFHMKLADSSVEGDISEFFIHVVNSSSGLISEDNAEGFDMVGSFFIDLINWEDLSLSSFGLKLSSKMIPEFRFSDDLVGSK